MKNRNVLYILIVVITFFFALIVILNELNIVDWGSWPFYILGISIFANLIYGIIKTIKQSGDVW